MQKISHAKNIEEPHHAQKMMCVQEICTYQRCCTYTRCCTSEDVVRTKDAVRTKDVVRTQDVVRAKDVVRTQDVVHKTGHLSDMQPVRVYVIQCGKTEKVDTDYQSTIAQHRGACGAAAPAELGGRHPSHHHTRTAGAA